MSMENDFTTGILDLQDQLDGVLNRVQHNDVALKRLQTFETKLLNINQLAEMLDYILVEGKDYFNLDEISLCLVDENDEVYGYLEELNYDFKANGSLQLLKNNSLIRSTFGFSMQPYIGVYKASKCNRFFSKLKRKPASVAIVPMVRRGRVLGSLNLASYSAERFIADMGTDFVEHMVSVVSICLENNLNFELMRRNTYVDTLTGVNNRRYLEQRILEEINEVHRNPAPLACLFLDIDHFKQVNDNYGHQVGDNVLTLVAKTIKKELRQHDVAARYGGEEFVVLLKNSDISVAEIVAERIRIAVQNLAIDVDKNVLNITLSVGLCVYFSDALQLSLKDIAKHLIKSADTALYKAKNEGRNRIKYEEFPLTEVKKKTQNIE